MPLRDSSHTGARGELLFANHFLEQRLFISQPMFDLWGADFCVEWEGALHKVNVKTMCKVEKDDVYKVATVKVNASSGLRRYSSDEISYFGVVNLHYGRIWMVPLEAIDGKCSLNYKGPMERRRRNDSRAFDWEKYRIR